MFLSKVVQYTKSLSVTFYNVYLFLSTKISKLTKPANSTATFVE